MTPARHFPTPVGPWLVVIGLGLAALLPLIRHTVIYLYYPFSLDETEGYVMGQVHRLGISGDLYGPIDEAPYVVDNYPPGWPVLLHTLEGVVGAEWKQPERLPKTGVPADDPRSVHVPPATFAHSFALPRGVALVCLLGICGAILLSTRAGWWGVLAVVLVLAQPPVYFMTALGRADWGALLLGWVGLALCLRSAGGSARVLTPQPPLRSSQTRSGEGEPDQSRLAGDPAADPEDHAVLPLTGSAELQLGSALAPPLQSESASGERGLGGEPSRADAWASQERGLGGEPLALLLALTALLFRQSAIMPLLAIALWLVIHKHPRRWLLIGLTLGAGIFIAFLLAGQWPLLFDHTVVFTKTRWLLARLIETNGFLIRYSTLFLMLSALAWWSRRDEGWTLDRLYLPLAASTLLLSAKVGSDMNYFLETLFACGWTLALAFKRWHAESGGAPQWLGAAICLVLLQSAILDNPRAGSYEPNRFDVANGTVLLRELQRLPPEAIVISEEEGILALAGREVWFNPFIMTELARTGMWDETPVLGKLQRREIPIVIVRELPDPAKATRDSAAGWNRFTPAMTEALATHYQPYQVVPFRREWIVLIPKR